MTNSDLKQVIHRGRAERLREMEERRTRDTFTVDEFEDNFDELFERVENGETLTIIHTDGKKVLIMPLDKITTECLTGSTLTSE